jgi:HEAT repeat protein
MNGLACAVDALYQPAATLRAVGLKALQLPAPLVTGLDLEAAGGDGLVVQIAQRAATLLQSPKVRAKLDGAYALGLLGHRVGVAPLTSLVLDPDPNVRREVIAALAEIRDPDSLEALIRAAHGRDSSTGFDAVNAIIKIGGPGAHEALLGIVRDRKLDRGVRTAAADQLRASNDPVAVKAADRYLAGTRPQWKPAVYLAPLLYVLAIMASRRGQSSRRNLWAWALYLAASASIIFLINPAWFLTGQETGIFWGLALWYPIGVGIGVLPIVGWLKLRQHDEWARAVGQRIGRCVLVMWGTLAAWVVVVFVLMIVGLGLAWR